MARVHCGNHRDAVLVAVVVVGGVDRLTSKEDGIAWLEWDGLERIAAMQQVIPLAATLKSVM